MRAVAHLLAALAILAGCADVEVTGQIPEAPSRALAGAAVSDAPRLLATLPQTGGRGLFRQVSARDGLTEWRARDGSGLVFRSGILLRTYALGHDLHAADAGDLLDRFASGQGGRTTRIHRYIDGENREIVRAFVCDVAFGPERGGPGGAVRDITERCAGTDMDFTNRYVRARSGRIVSSAQWVGPEVGYLRTGPPEIGRPAIVPIAVTN